MDDNLHSFGNDLNKFFVQNRPIEAERLISQVNKTFTESELSSFTIDTYLLSIFNKTNGLLIFLNNILYKPEYKNTKLKCFELLYTLVNSCTSKVQNYSIDIIKACAPVVRSSVSANEKQKSLQLITLIILKGNLHADRQNDVDTELGDLYNNTLYKCLHCRFDKSNTVQEELLVAIGAVAKNFPTVISEPSKLQNTLVNQLNAEIHKSNKSFPVITGAIKALSNFLENFAFNSEEDKGVADTIYKCVKILADPGDASRRVAFRESLSLVTKHIVLLSNKLYSESKWWHTTLLKWFTLGIEDKKAAYGVLDAFHREMANILSIRSENSDHEIFKYFMDYFIDVIEKSSAENYEMQLAIRGYGLLARSFMAHITPQEINKTFITISQIMEHTYILNSNINSDQIMYLPHYVETLSYIIKNLPQLSDSHITCLQRVSILLIKIFPRVSHAQHFLVIDALVLTSYQLLQCRSKLLQIFLEDVVYQGVLWTCSHQIAVEVELYKQEEDQVTTYKNYLPLWNGLLGIINSRKYEIHELNIKKRKLIVRKLVDELIKTLFVLINKLNLNTKLRDTGLPITDPQSAYEAIQTNDFVVFVNIVDFYQNILENVDKGMFEIWISRFINQVILKSMKHPLVSGFYKLLAVCLKVADSFNYFEESKLIHKEDLTACYQSVCKFLQEILWKMKQYKGDLQVACMQVILAAPICTVTDLLPCAAPAFIALFAVGRSYLELANLGIDTLERWLKHFPQNDFIPFLKQVLPSLDSYLKSRSLGGNVMSAQVLKSRKTKLAVSKRKVLVETESELLKLQIRILTFIGLLDNDDLYLTFVSSGDSVESVVWNKAPSLKISLPYADTKLNLYMDKFIPRCIELALYSSDRKIRVSSCELLHAIVMIILGTSHPIDPSKLKDLDCLIKAVCAPILKLGCDMDQVIQQLFSPLAVQLMHYYSQPRQMYSSHTQIIIEALIEAITNPTDSALRDFAGICIKEFVLWTIKQADQEDLKNNPINIKLWVRTMYSFSLHPDPFKRLGAALIFNQIYTVLREETLMFNMFWLEILYAFVMNLSLIQVNNMDDNNCIEQVFQALNHVQRGFVEKHSLFNSDDKIRRKPPGFEGTLLKDVAMWLLKETGSTNPYCRQKCMDMFCKIAPLVTNCKNLQTFKQLFVNDFDWIVLTYEAEILKNPTLNNGNNSEGTNNLFNWMQGLICALDGYIFVISNNLMPNTSTAEKSKFYETLQFFLQSVQLQGLDDVMKLISNIETTKVYTAIERENFNTFKSSIVTKIIKFASVFLTNKADLTYITPTSQLLWDNNMWNLICYHIFYVSTLGFDLTNDYRCDELIKLLNEINKCCSASIVNSLINALATYIISTLKSNSSSELNIISLKQRHLLKGMLLLQQTCLAEKLNIVKYVTGTIKSLLNGLTESKDGKRVVVKLHNSAFLFWELRLDIALQDTEEFNDMVYFMCNQTNVTMEEQNEVLEYGTYFFEKFQKVIVQHIHTNYALFIDKVFKLGTVDKAVKYIIEMLRYVYHNSKNVEPRILQSIVGTSLDKIVDILSYFESNTMHKLLGIEFITKLAYISIEPLHNLTEHRPGIVRWLINLITFEDVQWNTEANLNFKAEVFKVLSFVIGTKDEFDSQLQFALQNLKENYFTIKQNNLNIAQLTVFKNLLETVKISKSKMLLISAVNLYVTAPFDTDEIDLNCVLKPYMRSSAVEHQTATLHDIHEMCFDAGNFTSRQRYLLASNVLTILLKYCCYDAFEQFYISIISSLLSFLDIKDKSSFSMVYTVNKIIAYIFIEVLFSRIRTENIENDTCPITNAALSGKGFETKLAKKLTQYALSVCKESYNLDSQEEKDMFRLYQCHSYNALVSIISNTQKEQTFYNWLFSREENKQDILWRNLVDIEKHYSFSIDFDTVPSMKKILVNIRKDLLAARKNIDPDAHTIKYIESQHLFKSTLSEDITRFDFTNTTLRNQTEGTESKHADDTSSEFQISLEVIDINKHECMATICGLIQHMFENDITPLPLDNENILVLPKWMKAITSVMMNETTPKNVKLFLAKVIHNTHYMFKPYAKWFISPILKVIVDGCVGNTMNFFITDLVIMITSWSHVAIPIEDQELASKLLQFMMENADSDHRAIFKYNLEQIKLVLEVWKSCLVIPYDFLYQKLQLEITSPKLDVGVHLVATVLANNIPPWHATNLAKFLKTLTKILKSTHRSVYQPCAEVLGMSLKYMSTDANCSQHLDKFKEFVEKCLSTFIEDDDKFAYCLQGLALHFPEIADPFLCKMVSKLSHIHGNFKCMYLNVFIARIAVLQAINELSSIDFQKLLCDENFEVQVLTLEIIQKSVEYLMNTQLNHILKDVAKFVNNSVTIYRSIIYDIVITSYNIHCTQQSEASKEIIETCKNILLQGLVDKESALQEKVITFWSSVNNLPVNVAERFLYLLGNMYKANIEEHYISYSTYLLLNVLSSTEEFNEKLFEYALYDCDFHDYQLISNWRRQHASIAPLFAETMRSQDNTLNPMNLNVLRATVSTLEFQATEAGPSTSTFKYSLPTSRSLLFDTATAMDNKTQDGVFKDPNHVLPITHGIRSKRFLRDKSKISRHCAYLETRKSLKAEELRKDRIKQSERNVTIYRKYRIGDYPDIEITLSSVIAPLQMLARCDAVLARSLYVCLFTSLFGKINTDGNQNDNFIQNVKMSIENIFTCSTQYIPNTIGTFLDIALKYKNAMQFDANIITNVCHSSGLFSVGSLLLEEYLISGAADHVIPTKRRRGIENENVLVWIKFAELYKEIDEWDVVSAIFLEKLNCNEMVLSAIEAESCGNWRSAQECYAKVIAEDVSEERRDFYYESYFKCFAALGEWNKLSDVIKETVTSSREDNVWTSLWDNSWNQQKLLPWYMTAELRNILHGSDRKLFVSVNESLNDNEKFAYLKLYFGEELAMLWLLQNDTKTATYYLNNGIINFLENWSHLNPLFVKLRINKVFNLRNLIDIHVFLNGLNDINLGNHQNIVEALLKSWQETTKDFMESLILSETRTVYRNQFISALKTKLQSILSGDEMQHQVKSLDECKFKLHLNLVETALDQANYYVARKYIKLSPKPNANKQIEMMQWSLALSKILFLRAQTVDDSNAKLSLICDSWSQINTVHNLSVAEDIAMCYLIKTKEHIHHLTQQIFTMISRNELLFNMNQNKFKKLMGDFQLENIEDIGCFGMLSLKNSLDFCENEILLMMNSDNLKIYEYMSKAYVKLAYYVQNKEQFEGDFISFVLKAMKHGSLEGKQLFPCLLSKDIGITYKDIFTKQSSEIPTWMFLRWLPQLLANLDTSCIFVISDILLQIANAYPQAIMYAYRLSKEKYMFKSDSVGLLGQQIIKKLDELLLRNDLIDKFLTAVACVAPPINILNYHMRKLLNACKSKQQFNDALQKIFAEIYSETPDYKNPNSIQGSMFKEIRKYETKLKNISKGNFDKFEQSLKGLQLEINSFKYKKSTKLMEYSPWLANFQATNLHANLEIPGQYTGDKRPLTQYHIKVMGFSQNVQLLSSIRAPIRITILGNDAREYHYLIKYGEDLRQDQRIEQLFTLMNNILLHDPNCHKRQLSIYTYQVIPLNSSLGIIEWVNNTSELKQFIENGIEDQQDKLNYKKADAEYSTWIVKAQPRNQKGTHGTSYGFASLKYSRDNVICKYRTLVNSVSMDVLRKSFWNISVNSESFFALRQKFVVSYAVMCLSHWLLGIGDRHLLNCLVSLHTGHAIGIDFGHAFGTATQILQVPELVPFRLTPHILYLLQPLGELGLLQETMIHCLRAFRKNRDILIATMNVFIKEPSLDWLEFARRNELNNTSSDNPDWYPNQKILHAQQKLEGANPTTITIEELKAGHSHTQFLDAYVNLVKGLPEHNFRARKADDLSEEDQVKCLLDQSTDYNLLGRMWVGWQPWI